MAAGLACATNGGGLVMGGNGGRLPVNGRLGEPRMVAKGSHERQTRMSRRRRHRSSANSSRFPANTGLDELRTVVTSMPRVEEKKGETKKLSKPEKQTGGKRHRTLFCFGRLFCHNTQ